jgi:GTP-binding protein
MKKLPRVVIVGFPNVGKSTLFNRILGKRKALVHSQPGMTRDNVSLTASAGGKRFVLVDTGGLFGVEEEPLSAKVRERAWKEAVASDLVLFVLDGKRDVSPSEEELYTSLIRLDKPVLLVVNKIDTASAETRGGDFFRLGAKDCHLVSAEHNLNIGPLAEAVAAALPPGRDEAEGDHPLRIAIVGRVNVGKSSLVNRLLGEERLLVSEIPGTTRDSTDTIVWRDKKAYCLVDTAGIRRLAGTRDSREKAGIIRAKANIKSAEAICLVLDVQEFPTRQDAHIAQLAHESGKPLLIALNKWDLVDTAVVDAEAVRAQVRRKLGFVDYAPLLFVSALSGQRLVKVLELAEKVHANASRRIETSRLNEFLSSLEGAHPPRAKGGERIKLKYMTQKGILPPSFILFTNTGAPLAAAYEKFFLGRLREAYDFQGTPVRLNLRKS